MSVEDDVRAATVRFYDAIDQMVTGKGLEAMTAAWHHDDFVTAAHPTGDWARGWEPILATWEAFSLLGGPQHAGSQILDLVVRVNGDLAYTTGTFVTAPSFGAERFNVTNVLERIRGEWKIVHHHADKSPGLAAAIAKILEG